MIWWVWRSVRRSRFVAMLFYDECHTRVPRFRLLAPLRGSTPRRLSVLVFALTPLCRSAQNDTAGGVLREWYNMSPLKLHCGID